MDTNELKYVVGKAETDQPAIIRFFDSVNEYSCKNFNDEFLWLQDYVKPSKIIVLINSEGGSVLHGMSTFSIINNCPIDVDCVVEGIAASMGSVIWAAGKNLYMHDYSILMIHNPFYYDKENASEDAIAMINAFRGQLSTIYQRRFGLSQDEVDKIMDGEGNVDGTYFSAKDAVKAGFIGKENVIKTTKQTRDKVKNQIEGMTEASSMREALTAIAAELGADKLVEAVSAIHSKTEEEIQTNKAMDAKDVNVLSFGTIAAQLGFPTTAEVGTVSARISELINAETSLAEVTAKVTELDEVKSELGNVKIQLEGAKTEAANANAALQDALAKLKVYQDAEKAARDAEIEAMVQAAIDACKIDESSKANWIAMAQTNFDMVKNTLDSIQARDKISEKIADDPAAAQAAQESLRTAEEKMAEQVKAVLGGDIQFKKF